MLSTRAFGGRFFTLGVSLALVAILILVFLPKIDRELDNLEQSRFEFRLAELRTAVQFKQLELQARSELSFAEHLTGANPFSWLKGRLQDYPSHYLGEKSIEEIAATPGNWVYDPSRKRVYYYSLAELDFAERKFAPNSCLSFQVETLKNQARVAALKLAYVNDLEAESCFRKNVTHTAN